MKTRRNPMAFTLFLPLLASASFAQDDVCKDIVELVDRAVPDQVGDPALLKELLDVQAGPQFADGFLDTAADMALPAVQSRLRLSRRRCVADDEGELTCRFANRAGTELLKFEQRTGKAAYLNQTREWTPQAGNNRIPEGEAMELAHRVIKAWGIPEEELDLQFAEVRRLNLAGTGKLDARPTDIFSTELHVRFPRRIAGVPVFDSDARLSIDVRGRVARMRVMWPSFGLVPGLEPIPLSREDVVKMTAQELSDGAICGSLSRVEAYIAYSLSKEVTSPDPNDEKPRDPAAEQEGGAFVPALVVYAVPNEPREDSGEALMGGRQLVMPLLDAREGGR
jgi:hypothetical protein